MVFFLVSTPSTIERDEKRDEDETTPRETKTGNANQDIHLALSTSIHDGDRGHHIADTSTSIPHLHAKRRLARAPFETFEISDACRSWYREISEAAQHAADLVATCVGVASSLFHPAVPTVGVESEARLERNNLTELWALGLCFRRALQALPGPRWRGGVFDTYSRDEDGAVGLGVTAIQGSSDVWDGDVGGSGAA